MPEKRLSQEMSDEGATSSGWYGIEKALQVWDQSVIRLFDWADLFACVSTREISIEDAGKC